MITLLLCLVTQVLTQTQTDITLTTDTSLLYFTNLDLGSSKNLLLKIDTIRTHIAVPGAGCTVGKAPCGKPTNLYNMTSPFASFLPCTALYCQCAEVPKIGKEKYCVVPTAYSGCSFEETSNRDELHFNELKLNITFGMIFSATPHYFPATSQGQIYGILGLGSEESSEQTSITSFYQQLVSAQLAKNIFSMCLGPAEGHLVLGGVDPNYAKDPIQWFRWETSRYSLTITKISTSNDSTTGFTQLHTAYIDSGEADVLLSPLAFKAIQALLLAPGCDKLPFGCDSNLNNTIFGPGSCFQLTEKMLSQYPTLEFTGLDEQRNPIKVIWEPSFYFKSTYNHWGIKCVALAITESPRLPDNVMILGNSFVRRYHIIFDRVNSLIGLTEAKCGNWTVGVEEPNSLFLEIIILGSVFVFMATMVSVFFLHVGLASPRAINYELVQ